MAEMGPYKSGSKPIASTVLDDGTILEMLHRREQRETCLVGWDGQVVGEAASVGSLRPFSPDNNLLTHGVVLFPSAVGEDVERVALLAAVRAFVHRYADLSSAFEEVASVYVLLTWIYDAFNEVPYLRLKGDFGSGKSRCLQTIGSICYKPMFVSGASTVSPMFRIIDSFRGTLILDESDFRFSDERVEIIKILNNGNAAGFPVLRSEATPTKEFNPRAFFVYGPKIIATRRDFEDPALESRCITETMTGLPPRGDIPLTLPDSFQAEATELRNKLLRFRFKNLRLPRSPTPHRGPELEARIAQIYAPLIGLAPDEAIRNRLLAIARGHTVTIRAARSTSVEAQLLDIMYQMQRDGVPLIVRDITALFDERFAQDYERPITARWIGGQLRRRLSLTPVKSHGTFMVPETDHSRLRAHFERYGTGDIRADVGTSGMSPGVPGPAAPLF